MIKIEEYLRKQLLIAFCIYMGNIMTGYSTGWSSPVLDKLYDADQIPLPEAITDAQASWIASSFLASVIVGPVIFGLLANIIGRKPCILISSLLLLIGYGCLAVSLSIVWIYFGQVIKGLGSSGLLIIGCMYIGEIASSNIRGILLASTVLIHSFGVLLVYSVGPFVSYRAVSYVIMAVNVVHFLGCLFLIPETPVFHVVKGNEDAAKKVLIALGRSKDIDTELPSMISAQKEDEAEGNWMQLVTVKSNRMALIIASVLLVLNQAGGVMSVLFYATSIFRAAGSSVEPEIATIILGATQFIGTIICPLFIDKYGRKTLMCLSSSLCSLFLAILGVYFYLDSIDHSSIPSIGWLPLFCLVSFLFSFSFGVNAIPSAIVGEIFQPNVRSSGSTAAFTIASLLGFASTTSFNYIIAAAGSHTMFWIFAGINILGCIFTIFVVPETKGKSLMEIEAMLG